MRDAGIIAFDLVAIVVLTYVVYFRRHRRRNMLLAYVGLNVGVLTVTLVLTNAAVGAGLGFGLFGVLSIIRLRSSEITQEEVAYYFISLALGLACGVEPDPAWLTPVLGTLMVVVMFVADHPRVYARYRQQLVTLDAAYTDEHELVKRLEGLLGARVRHYVVNGVDLVRDTTVVDVRYELRRPGYIAADAAPSPTTGALR